MTVTWQLGELTRSTYPTYDEAGAVIGQTEHDAIPVSILVDGAPHAEALYCIRPGTALGSIEDIQERAQHEADRVSAALDLLHKAGAEEDTFDGVNVLELSMLPTPTPR